MKISLDMDSLTLGELEFFETESGLTLEDFAAGKSNTRATMALICIQERRTKPEFSMDDARAIRVSDIEFDEAPPTPAAKGRTKAAS